MNPPDEDLDEVLSRVDVPLLFPSGAYRLHVYAAEYMHRFGRPHPNTARIGQAGRRMPLDGWRFWNTDVSVDELIALWRMRGATWTNRTPPRFLPPAAVLHVASIGTLYRRDDYTYRVHRHCADVAVLQDVTRAPAFVTPTYDDLEMRYQRPADMRRVYRFGGPRLYPSSLPTRR